jgi:serine/threonine-protein kinase
MRVATPAALQSGPPSQLALTTGTRLGPYEITAPLGVGGMGEVYRATDTNLKRQVAIKVLPASVGADGERLARFQREAEILAALNHPNIAHIHGLEKSAGIVALVMELVEGPTLSDRIARGALPIEEALLIAKQIAQALEAAHEQGIIHRDLKPANIKVREDGTVKVLDFGLAKAMDVGTGRAGTGDELTQSPTLSLHATQAGMILGTAPYMSPEQATGKVVDKRSDLWSFGVVLFEILTGTPAFSGETVSHVLAAVLKDEPDWSTLPATTPAPIHRLLRRCLEKDRRRRSDSAADARLEIDDAMAPPAAERPVARTPFRRGWLFAFAVIGTALLAVLMSRAWTRPGPPVSSPLVRLSIVLPRALALSSSGLERNMAVAPDGSFVVYFAAGGQLVVRRLDRLEVTPLAGVSCCSTPFVSPDSRWIGFLAQGLLKKVAVGGGAPITLARLPAGNRGATWLDDNSIIAATNNPTMGLLRVPAGGGEPTVLTTPDRTRGEMGHIFPSALPGGRAVLFTIATAQPANAQIAVLDLQTRQYTTLITGGSDAQYLSSGHLVYVAGGTLSVVRFDLTRLAVVGDPVSIDESVSIGVTGAADAAFTREGTLVYALGGVGPATPRLLVSVDRQGHETPIPAPARAYSTARLSPDGTRIAVDIRDQSQDLWLWDLALQTLKPLTFNAAPDLFPAWTPDSRRIVFASMRDGIQNIYTLSADGTGTDLPVTTSETLVTPNEVTRDGFVVGYQNRPQDGSNVVRSDIVRVALDGSGAGGVSALERLVEFPSLNRNASVSPDLRFLAYQSNRTGRFEIYVQSYPDGRKGRWTLTTTGGTFPAWTRNGTELVYLDASKHMTSVTVDPNDSTFRPSAPTTLFDRAYAETASTHAYDVSPDGDRFLMIKEATGAPENAPPPGFVVVEHWFEELRRLAATK